MEIKSLKPKLRQHQKKNYVAQVVFYNGMDKIQIGFHPIESQQILIKEDKRPQIQTLMILHIMNMTSKDLKWPQKTSEEWNR